MDNVQRAITTTPASARDKMAEIFEQWISARKTFTNGGNFVDFVDATIVATTRMAKEANIIIKDGANLAEGRKWAEGEATTKAAIEKALLNPKKPESYPLDTTYPLVIMGAIERLYEQTDYDLIGGNNTAHEDPTWEPIGVIARRIYDRSFEIGVLKPAT